MMCRKCGTDELRIHKTWLGTKVNRRQQRCRCGYGWTLIERIEPGTEFYWAEGEVKCAEVKGETSVKQPDTNGIPKLNEHGISGSFLSIPNQTQSSDPKSESSLLGKPRARRGRPSTVEYTPDFIAFWDALKIRSGNKLPAFDAWVKVPGEIRANAERMIFVFNRWCETERWQNGCPLHVSTWLNQAGWENEPAPQLFKRTTAPAAVPYAKRVDDESKSRHINAMAKLLIGG
jgi:hypothetical protein